ncbi:MAG: TolC family protein [Kofleriaceae bacterium]
MKALRTSALAVVLTLVSSRPGAAPARRPTDLAAFQRELDAVFVKEGLTAEDAAARAAKAAPHAERKQATVEGAEADLTRAKLALLPVLSGRGAYTRLSPLDSVISLGGQTLTIPSLTESYLATGQVSVPLSDYLLRAPAQISGAGHALRAARLDQKATRAAVRQLARETYYEWLRVRLQVLVAKRQLVQVEATLARIRDLLEVERAANADLLRVESQRAQAAQTLAKLTAAAALREEQLRLLIGADDDEELTIGEDIRLEVPAEDAAEDADTTAARRFELQAVDQAIQAKESLRSAEVAALLPRVSAFATVDYARPNPRQFPQRDIFQWSWMAGVQVTWVINESLVATTTRRKLAAEAAELRADRDGLAQRLHLEVLAARQGVELARTAITTSQQGLEAAEEGYRVRKDAFAAGRSSVVEIVDVEAELARARIAALDARIDLRIALDKLAYATQRPEKP